MSENGVPGRCFPVELNLGDDTHFSYWNQYDVISPSAWVSADVYYGWDGQHEWAAPSETVPDRMVAWVELRTTKQVCPPPPFKKKCTWFRLLHWGSLDILCACS